MQHNSLLGTSKLASGAGKDAEIDKSELRRKILFRLTLVVAAVLIWLIILVNLIPN